VCLVLGGNLIQRPPKGVEWLPGPLAELPHEPEELGHCQALEQPRVDLLGQLPRATLFQQGLQIRAELGQGQRVDAEIRERAVLLPGEVVALDEVAEAF
jgi:hypothetical protein